MTKPKLTTIKLTSTTKYLEKAICEETGMPVAKFHRRAIDNFIEKGGKVEDELKITAKTDPRYIKKEEREFVYLDDERREKLEEISAREGVGITIVLYQAIMDYCMDMSSLVSDEVIKSILGNK